MRIRFAKLVHLSTAAACVVGTQLMPARASAAIAGNLPAKNYAISQPKPHSKAPATTYAVRYQRYGVLGFYHVNMLVDRLRDGVRVQRFYFDGAGRVQRLPISLGLFNFHIGLLPAYLDGHLNTEGHTKHFCRLLTSNEFGPTYALTNEQGTKLLTMAHHSAVNLHQNRTRFYFTIPVHLGFIELWTSNSVVASLVKNANVNGIPLPMPTGGNYPGFDGPYLPKSVFE